MSLFDPSAFDGEEECCDALRDLDPERLVEVFEEITGELAVREVLRDRDEMIAWILQKVTA